ncbi:MAG: hypothetical protein WAS51_14405 [Ilumatobacteraceae bacterium]
MQMDGYPVLVNDRVYDTQYGWGEVEQLLVDNRAAVVFTVGSKSLRHVYDANGVGTRFKTRTLYWHDPIIAVPAKSDNGWTKIQQICRAVVDTLRVI